MTTIFQQCLHFCADTCAREFKPAKGSDFLAMQVSTIRAGSFSVYPRLEASANKSYWDRSPRLKSKDHRKRVFQVGKRRRISGSVSEVANGLSQLVQPRSHHAVGDVSRGLCAPKVAQRVLDVAKQGKNRRDKSRQKAMEGDHPRM